MTLEYTITLGSLLQTVTLMGVVIGFYYKLENSLALVKNDMEHLQKAHHALTEAFSQLGKILTQVALQDGRISMIEKRLDELSHGEGFVRKSRH